MPMTAFCARRNLAAETIFMAEVICCVELTEAMRVRTSLRLAIHAMFSGYGLLVIENLLNLLVIVNRFSHLYLLPKTSDL